MFEENKLTVQVNAKGKMVDGQFVIADLAITIAGSPELADNLETGRSVRKALVEYLSKGEK